MPSDTTGVYYEKNGNTFYTSTVAPNFPLSIDTSFYARSDRLKEIKWIGSKNVRVVAKCDLQCTWKDVPLEDQPDQCVTPRYNSRNYKSKGIKVCCPKGWKKYGDGSGCQDLKNHYCYTYGNDLMKGSGCPHPCPSVVRLISTSQKIACTKSEL